LLPVLFASGFAENVNVPEGIHDWRRSASIGCGTRCGRFLGRGEVGHEVLAVTGAAAARHTHDSPPHPHMLK
jgi:hypothetical protein